MSARPVESLDGSRWGGYSREVILRRAFRYRLYPTPEQGARLDAWDKSLRWLWNLAHEQRLMVLGRCRDDRRIITAFDQINELTALRAEYPWLVDVPRDVLAQCLVELDAAWQRFFAGLADRPCFKKRGCDRAPLAEPHPKAFRVEGAGKNGRLVFPKIGAIRAVVHRPHEGKEVARRQKGSKNQAKAKKRVAGLHRKVRRQRDHVLHGLSHNYTKSHGVIVLERLEIRGMTASAGGTVEVPGVNVRAKAGLNRSILGAGWGKFATMLDYKAIPEGVRVLEVSAHYTSQTCSGCGHIASESRRSQSEFECVACGLHANADTNAARVILARGLRVLADEASVTGCGGRRRPAKQQLRVVRHGQRSQVGHSSSSKAPAFRPG